MNKHRVIWRRDRETGRYERQFMEHPEKSLVEGLQNLQVLAAYDFQKMDELVQDLTNALEETTQEGSSSKQRSNGVKGSNGQKNYCPSRGQKMGTGPCSTLKKRRSKRRRPNTLAPSDLQHMGNMSEASESSLDEALRDYLENLSHNHSDSDHDVVFNTRRLQSLTSSLPQVVSFAESDSLAENISPMRPQRRRKRQFIKKMAIDSMPTDVDVSRTVRMDPEALQRISDTQPGKRKWCTKDKSTHNSFDMGPGDEESKSDMHDTDSKCDTSMSESGGSVVSSSESDGLYTNDEGRDGDDEQSDFFHEAGPACGIPGIIPWWENDSPSTSSSLSDALQRERDPNFESILTGSFQHMSDSSKRSYKARLKMLGKSGREIRAGRRHLKDRIPGYSLSTFLKDRQKWSDSNPSRFSWQQQPNTNGRNSSGSEHFKRPRKTPPAPEEVMQGEFVGENAEPIPDTNIGNRLLQSMGWTPGTGLGVEGKGMVNPLVAYKRLGRKGLGMGMSRPQTKVLGKPDVCLIPSNGSSKNS